MPDEQNTHALQRAWQVLTAPRAADADEARQEHMTKVILVILGGVALVGSVPALIRSSVGATPASPLTGVSISALLIGGWVLAQRGHWRVSRYIPPVLVFLAALYDNYLEGVGASAMLYYAIAILLAAMLLGARALWGTLALSLVAYLGLGAAHVRGYLPSPPVPEAAFGSWAISATAALITIAALQGFSLGQYRRAIVQARASAVEVEEANQRTLQRSRVLAQLNRLGQDLAATLDLRQIAEQLPRVAAEIIGTESASVWLIDAGQKEVVCWAAYDHLGYQYEQSPVAMRLKLGQGIAGWVADSGESVIAGEPLRDPRFFSGVDQQTGFQTRSMLAVPLRARKTIIGSFEMLNKPVGTFTADDLAMVETLAASVAIAIDNARLVEALRQYTAELEAQNAELDAFAHTVAHDLKNPLSVLVGLASLLAECLAELPAEEVRAHVQRIEQYAAKMSSIVGELLLLASVRKQKDVPATELDMAAIVAQARIRLEDVIVRSQAEIITVDADAWPAALGYAAWVEEVWANYISNAIKYGGSPPRVELGFTILDCRSPISDLPGADESGTPARVPSARAGARVQDPRSEIQNPQYIKFWVRDNGAGLSAEQQAQLFTQFTRLHQPKVEGHGLGLSIVRRIVEKLGGQVGVESQPGQGSTFYFTLPGAEKE